MWKESYNWKSWRRRWFLIAGHHLFIIDTIISIIINEDHGRPFICSQSPRHHHHGPHCRREFRVQPQRRPGCCPVTSDPFQPTIPRPRRRLTASCCGAHQAADPAA